ncbi:hypothetical protein AB0J47_18280 [Nocardia sp. NPDC049737]|uniref:hypothetical protein n=1 Tax=Nocardia sp. NPDC049737 TaxID=3154358 RepID=UPI0034159B19
MITGAHHIGDVRHSNLIPYFHTAFGHCEGRGNPKQRTQDIEHGHDGWTAEKAAAAMSNGGGRFVATDRDDEILVMGQVIGDGAI